MLKPLFIVKAGKTFEDTIAAFGDMEDLIAAGLEQADQPLERVNALSIETLPDPAACSGIIVSGAHTMVTDKPAWSERLARWMADAVRQRIPLLGICYGHQLLAHALGGRAGFHPRGREVGTVLISLTEDGKRDRLLGSLPEVFPAHVTHAQSALEIPPGAVILARNDFEPCQAFRFGDNAWGVQFHPEFSAGVIQTYISHQEDALRDQGEDIAALRQAVCETPESNSLLKRFAALSLTTGA